jgi:hypothetical protein
LAVVAEVLADVEAAAPAAAPGALLSFLFSSAIFFIVLQIKMKNVSMCELLRLTVINIDY